MKPTESISLSAVVPTIGRPEYLDIALGSLLAQSDPFDEIVVFDNSGDCSARKTSQFHDNCRIRWESSNLQLPAIESWNTAVSKANSEYVTIFGDDDLAEMSFAGEFRLGLCQGEFVYLPFHTIDSKAAVLWKSAPTKACLSGNEFRYQRMRQELTMMIPGFAFNRNAFLKLGGFQDSRLPNFLYSDDLLWFRLAALHGKIICGQTIAWNYRIHNRQIGRGIRLLDFCNSIPTYLNLLENLLSQIGVRTQDIYPDDLRKDRYAATLVETRLKITLSQQNETGGINWRDRLKAATALCAAPIGTTQRLHIVKRLFHPKDNEAD